jgi:hypothetical protein
MKHATFQSPQEGIVLCDYCEADSTSGTIVDDASLIRACKVCNGGLPVQRALTAALHILKRHLPTQSASIVGIFI